MDKTLWLCWTTQQASEPASRQTPADVLANGSVDMVQTGKRDCVSVGFLVEHHEQLNFLWSLFNKKYF